MTEGLVENIHAKVKARVVGFGIRPGERINEVALARDLNASRTPLREALNRLVAERLVEFRPGSGFYCRALDPQAIYELYEMRRILEVSAVMMAASRAKQGDLDAFAQATRAQGLVVKGLTVAQAVERDEAFHLGIARLTGNAELVAALAALNERIRFIRWIDMGNRVAASKDEHRRILDALLARDGDRAADVLADHISRRLDQVTEAVRQGISSIYMDGAEALSAQLVEEV